MKILVLQDRLRSGGTERQSLLLARAFAAAGHDTTLLTFRPGGALLRPPSAPGRPGGPGSDAGPAGPGVRHRALQPFDTGLDWFAPGLMRAVASDRPDVILCMGRMANCYAGSLQDLGAGTAVIATMRTGKALPWLFRRSLRQVRHIVANSHDARQTLVTRHGVAGERISVIHNSLVFPAATPPARDHARRAAWGASPATTVLLNVAMFRPEKNQRELIAIAGDLPRALNFQLWLAGDGPARPECERLVAARGWADVVKFLGYSPDPAPLYSDADLAVHASGSESLSNFLIEAQAHGLPAVACEAQGVAECCVPDETGFVIPRGDRTAFRAALIRLIREPAVERARRSGRARAFARETFDPARQTAAYLELFGRLAPASADRAVQRPAAGTP